MQRANLPLPEAGQPFHDPTFGVTLVRVSDTSSRGGWESHIYNQLQAFSSDNQYLLLTGANEYVVRRVSDFTLVEGLETGTWNGARWHQARPHVLVHYDSNDDTTARVEFTDLDTLATTIVYTFPARYHYIRPSQSFVELSYDGRWIAGLLTRNDGEQVIFSLDLVNRVLTNQLALFSFYASTCQQDPVYGILEPDWIGVSPRPTSIYRRRTRRATGSVHPQHHGDQRLPSGRMTCSLNAAHPSLDRSNVGESSALAEEEGACSVKHEKRRHQVDPVCTHYISPRCIPDVQPQY